MCGAFLLPPPASRSSCPPFFCQIENTTDRQTVVVSLNEAPDRVNYAIMRFMTSECCNALCSGFWTSKTSFKLRSTGGDNTRRQRPTAFKICLSSPQKHKPLTLRTMQSAPSNQACHTTVRTLPVWHTT